MSSYSSSFDKKYVVFQSFPKKVFMMKEIAFKQGFLINKVFMWEIIFHKKGFLMKMIFDLKSILIKEIHMFIKDLL